MTRDAGWVLTILAFVALTPMLSRRGRAPSGPRRREWTSLVGLLLQGLGFHVVLRTHETGATIASRLPVAGAWLLVILSALLLAASVALVHRAMSVLGRQWSLVATVRDDGQLVVAGPYAFVRHPIYTAMLGILVGSGMLIATPVRLLVGLAVALVGTAIRIRSEDRLLEGTFGDEFRTWARRVPALIPRLRGGSRAAT